MKRCSFFFVAAVFVGMSEMGAVPLRPIVRYGGLAAALAGGVYGIYQHRQAKRVSGARKKRNVAGVVAAAGVAAFLASHLPVRKQLAKKKSVFDLTPEERQELVAAEGRIREYVEKREKYSLSRAQSSITGGADHERLCAEELSFCSSFSFPEELFIRQGVAEDGWCALHCAIFTEKMLTDEAFRERILRGEKFGGRFEATAAEKQDFQRRLYDFCHEQVVSLVNYLRKQHGCRTCKDIDECEYLLDQLKNNDLRRKESIYHRTIMPIIENFDDRFSPIRDGQTNHKAYWEADLTEERVEEMMNVWGNFECSGHRKAGEWVSSSKGKAGVASMLLYLFLEKNYGVQSIELRKEPVWCSKESCGDGPFVYFFVTPFESNIDHLKGHAQVLIPRLGLPPLRKKVY